MIKYYILLPSLIFTIGICVIIPLGITQYSSDLDEYRESLESLVSTYVEVVQRYVMAPIITSGIPIQNLYIVKNVLTRDEHMRFSEAQLATAINGVGYIKRIVDANRINEETEASLYYNRTIVIKSLNGTSIIKPVYYPFWAIHPWEPFNNTIFLDVGELPIFKSFEKATLTGEMSLSDSFVLRDSTGYMIHYPVLNNSFIGAVVVMFDLQRIFLDRLADVATRRISVIVIDNRDDTFIAGVCGDTTPWYKCAPLINEKSISTNITIVDTTWRVVISPIGNISNFDYYLVFAIGLPILIVICVSLAFVLFIIDKRMIMNEIIIANTANELETRIAVDESKQTFIHYIFHEIRVPFQTIKLGLRNLSKHLNNTDEAQKTWNVMNISIEHAVTILNDILDVGKMEKGKFSINKEWSNFEQHLELLISGYNTNIEANGISFESIIHPDLRNTMVHMDIGRITQCISNMLSNAQKYTNKGKITLNIDITDRIIAYKNLWFIKVSVKDTGVGIAEDDQYKIFQPYEQIQNQSHEIGTGLGLIILKNIVELHDGNVGFNSSDDGSEFWFTIPVETRDKTAEESSFVIIEENIELPETLLNKPVLIVDDSEQNRLQFREYLSGLGFTNVYIAKDGFIAIEMVKDTEYFIIFMDYNMPNMNGIECSNHIKTMYNPHIIMITGAYIDKKEIGNNVDVVLQKPLNMQELKYTLIKFVKSDV